MDLESNANGCNASATPYTPHSAPSHGSHGSLVHSPPPPPPPPILSMLMKKTAPPRNVFNGHVSSERCPLGLMSPRNKVPLGIESYTESCLLGLCAKRNLSRRNDVSSE